MKSLPIKKTHVFGAALFAAALALPSYHAAFAEATPEHGSVAFKYLNYKESQPGADRMSVNAYTTSVMMPFAEKWSINASYTYDLVSGASPIEHDTLSGASISEHRNAADFSLTRYMENGSWALGGSFSTESDYDSKGISLQRSVSTEDKNTTVTFGGSYSSDAINGIKFQRSTGFTEKGKTVVAGLIGITKILTKRDIVQLNVAFSKGDGYFNDPYKISDSRPSIRNITTLMTRWNHHFDGTDGTGKFSYRYYTDTFDVKAHTFNAEYIQPLPHEFTVIPSARFSSQTAAFFYTPSSLYAAGIIVGPNSYDERLAAFGALTFGIKVEKRLTKDWTVDVKYEHYESRGEWCLSGGGDSGLQPFRFNSIQLGLARVL
jgi:hypothetical protein